MINIPLRVKNLIKRHGTASPRQIAADLGFKVFVYGDMPKKINGLWRRVLWRKYIFVDEKLAEWQQDAVIAHELAHYLCHKGYKLYSMNGRTYYCETRKEREADTFAAELMSRYTDLAPEYVLDFLANGWR